MTTTAGAPCQPVRGAGPRLLGQEPGERLAGDIRWHGVRTLELVVPNLVARPLEHRHDSSTAAVDGEHGVLGAMGDVQAWPAPLCGRGGEAGRETHHVREQVTIGQAYRQGVGGTVREP